MLFSKATHHCGAGLASQIWCLHSYNQAGIWQENVPNKNPLSYDTLRISCFWENTDGLRWHGEKHGLLWDPNGWDLQCPYLLSALQIVASPFPIRRIWLQPFGPSTGWNMGWSELNSIFSFFLYLLGNHRVGIGADGEVWDSVLWTQEQDFEEERWARWARQALSCLSGLLTIRSVFEEDIWHF